MLIRPGWMVFAGLVLIGLAVSAQACLWDSDTAAAEASGMSDIVAVITGRFPRNPPLYYEMRLDRVTDHLECHPEDLEAYDDAAVACDRLGRNEEAIAWMARKRVQLDTLDPSLPEVPEHEYRYHANLGTFSVHRWLRQGADRSRIAEVEQAREAIARALEINPEAHFGRERWQLCAIEWIIDPGEFSTWNDHLPNMMGREYEDIYCTQVDPEEAHEAVRGLTGLIVLGDAWESFDIFYTLTLALCCDSKGFEPGRNGGRNSLAYLARLRCVELIEAGHGSLVPDAPRGEALKAKLFRPDFVEETADSLLGSAFDKHRREAESWQAVRTAFMVERLEQGRHPDTDPGFWVGYIEQPAPSLPTTTIPEHSKVLMKWKIWTTCAIVIGFSCAIILACVTMFYLRSRSKAKRRARPEIL